MTDNYKNMLSESIDNSLNEGLILSGEIPVSMGQMDIHIPKASGITRKGGGSKMQDYIMLNDLVHGRFYFAERPGFLFICDSLKPITKGPGKVSGYILDPDSVDIPRLVRQQKEFEDGRCHWNFSLLGGPKRPSANWMKRMLEATLTLSEFKKVKIFKWDTVLKISLRYRTRFRAAFAADIVREV